VLLWWGEETPCETSARGGARKPGSRSDPPRAGHPVWSAARRRRLRTDPMTCRSGCSYQPCVDCSGVGRNKQAPAAGSWTSRSGSSANEAAAAHEGSFHFARS